MCSSKNPVESIDVIDISNYRAKFFDPSYKDIQTTRIQEMLDGIQGIANEMQLEINLRNKYKRQTRNKS